MRVLVLAFLLVGCASTDSDKSTSAPPQDESKKTDQCLDNPNLAKEWGECNVKYTVFRASDALGKCRKASPAAKGTVSYEVKIKADGHVKSVKRVTGPNNKHTTCVWRVFRHLQFAAPGKEATITVPYQLEP